MVLIQQFTPDPSNLYAQRYQFFAELSHVGHEITVVTERQPGEAARERLEGITVWRVGGVAGLGRALRPLALTAAALRRLWRTRPDVIYGHISWYIALATMLGERMLGRPSLFWYSGKAYRPFRERSLIESVKLMILIASMRRCSYVVTSAECVRQDLVRTWGLRPERVIVLPFGVNLDLYCPSDPPSLSGPPAFVFVGRLSEGKGVGTLLTALSHVVRKRVCRLIVVGGAYFTGVSRLRVLEDRLLAHYRHLAASLDVADHVEFTGGVPQSVVREILSQHPYAVFPFSAVIDGVSTALQEAMALGRCIVATSIAGSVEALGDAGIIVPPDSPDDLAAGMLRVLTDKDLARELCRRARAGAEDRFNMRRQVRRLSEWLDALPPWSTSPDAARRGLTTSPRGDV